jgi:tellurite resistance protein TerC
MFSRLKFGLAIILAFIGFKMILAPFFHFTSTYSLTIVGGILIISMLASVIWPEKKK